MLAELAVYNVHRKEGSDFMTPEMILGDSKPKQVAAIEDPEALAKRIRMAFGGVNG